MFTLAVMSFNKQKVHILRLCVQNFTCDLHCTNTTTQNKVSLLSLSKELSIKVINFSFKDVCVVFWGFLLYFFCLVSFKFCMTLCVFTTFLINCISNVKVTQQCFFCMTTRCHFETAYSTCMWTTSIQLFTCVGGGDNGSCNHFMELFLPIWLKFKQLYFD